MKKIIIRKPEFMRNDALMQKHLNYVNYVLELIEQVGPAGAEMQGLYEDLRYHYRQAAKAGGFLRMEDFWRWMDEQEKNPKQ